MLRRTNFDLAFILCIITFSSCRRTEPCSEATGILNFVSFTDAQTDSIIIRKYVKDSDFGSLSDSFTITRRNSIYEKSNDTLHILTSEHGDYGLDIKFDYEVYMPDANMLFKINKIVQEQTEINVGLSLDKRGCVNPIKSYIVNGQIINGAPNYSFIYITK